MLHLDKKPGIMNDEACTTSYEALISRLHEDYVFVMPMKVRDYEVDAEGIVNNANYLHYMEHTRHEYCEMLGFRFRDMHEQGLDPVLSHVDIRYRNPLRLADTMISCLNLSRRGPVFVFRQDIYNIHGEPVTQATVEVVCLENGRLSRGDKLAGLLEVKE